MCYLELQSVKNWLRRHSASIGSAPGRGTRFLLFKFFFIEINGSGRKIWTAIEKEKFGIRKRHYFEQILKYMCRSIFVPFARDEILKTLNYMGFFKQLIRTTIRPNSLCSSILYQRYLTVLFY